MSLILGQLSGSYSEIRLRDFSRLFEKVVQASLKGHNASYWVRKIDSNIERDKLHTKRLEMEGWHVIRLWESDIIKDPIKAAQIVVDACQKGKKR
ncbi:unnamed protein product [marine sediment metagenome]|uniref:DUF559 domain-containing protein n=1 Tax=marine sediment metagenome TaxID=412755 RepID=X1H5I5_9ZZZZ